ncbi:uncharacterized protein AMSG_00680 [Thecamonas trahens ATCC 50062]|uniref:Uncharacterized protein n=1 Tax=Thecamonas trahens ATCC 50062 TaxID=461836 RepID=A0A0L0DDZ8_THETB|nr:hypothetical protein AMSG_00680 [Thecamonas trahens ATCC 50062]KNC50519.1 hypothetical protein AMSG_00680 [Thecamonas trahens ATCC 50062]|eukprot:XP_013762411.1 hypothetical protein AMSG_00680 [Thecamonas trahens ATCC 50062]
MKVVGAQLVAALVVLCAVCTPVIQAVTFSQAVSGLATFQSEDGGFWNNDSEASSVKTTSAALFLASLYGTLSTIDSPLAASYLEAASVNGGYAANEVTNVADVVSTFHALRAYQHMGASVPQPDAVADFLASLLDQETGLFAATAGAKGDVVSTAYVFASLDILSRLDIVEPMKDSLKSYLEESLATSAKGVYFNFGASDTVSMEDIHAGILLGSFVDFPFEAYKSGLVDVIASLQNPNPNLGLVGGFLAAGVPGASATIQASFLAAESLKIMDADVAESVYLPALLKACRSRASGLADAAASHAIVALTGSFEAFVATRVGFNALNAAPNGDSMIQGTQFQPFVTVTAADGVPVNGLEVEIYVTLPGAARAVHELAYSAVSAAYTGHDTIDTAGLLGQASLEFSVSKHVAGIGQIAWAGSESASIGYGLEVTGAVTYGASDVAEGESVGDGVAFDYQLRLFNVTHEDLRVGDFAVAFQLRDASGVAVASLAYDGASASGDDAVAFATELSGVAVPTGALEAVFEVADGAGLVHTSAVKSYKYVSSMVASSVTVNGIAASAASAVHKLALGDVLTVAMEPAAMPDMRTLVHFDHSSAAAARTFVFQLTTEDGAVVASVEGTPSSGSSGSNVKVAFELEIPTSLSLVGTHLVKFAYVDAAGNAVELDNYDSAEAALWEDASPLSVAVPVHLEMSSAEGAPTKKDFYYGNVVEFEFTVVDTLSGKSLSAADVASAVADDAVAPGMYLVISHDDAVRAGRRFVSVRERATARDAADGFAISWTINPNAVQGDGILEVAAYDAAGTQLPVYKPNSENKVEYPIVIGGEIKVTSEPYSFDAERRDTTVFVSEFSLGCQGKKLANAQLRCSVFKVVDGAKAELFQVPVALGASNDAYQVSFAVPTPDAAGDYELAFYREVDRVRAAEQADHAARAAARAGTDFDPASIPAVEPMFSIAVNHAGSSPFQLPVRTEFVAFVIASAIFALIASRRHNM